MPATVRPFRGPDFFQQIRHSTEWRQEKGFFWGYDAINELNYVVMDATFHRLGVFDRFSSPGKFTDLAAEHQRLHPDVRVITNGQFFAAGDRRPAVPLGGQIIAGVYTHRDRPGQDNQYYTLGQYSGRGETAFELRQGRADIDAFQDALGGLRLLIRDGRRGTRSDLYPYDSFMTQDQFGKICLGIHRRMNCILVVAQKNHYDIPSRDLDHISYRELQDRLIRMGIEEAVVLDGNSSAALVMEGGTADPAFTPLGVAGSRDSGKEEKIPNGPLFQYMPVEISTISAFRVGEPDNAINDPQHFISARNLGLRATIELTTAGYALEIVDFGSIPSGAIRPLATEVRNAINDVSPPPTVLKAEHPASAEWFHLNFSNRQGINLDVIYSGDRDTGGHYRGHMSVPTETSSVIVNVSLNAV